VKALKINAKDGHLVLQVENPDDLWALSIIIKPGDVAGMKTLRKVKISTGEAVEADKKPMYLKIRVKKVEFHGFTADLRLSGDIIEGPEDIKGGHTFNLRRSSRLDLWKLIGPEDLELIKEHQTRKPQVAVILVDREGALVAFRQQKIPFSAKLPGKRDEGANEEQAFRQFFGQLRQAVMAFEPEFVVVAGPGFVKDRLATFLKQDGLKVVVESVSSVSESGLREVFGKKTVEQVAGHMREVEEEKLVNDLYARVSRGRGAFYGPVETEACLQEGNVESLLVAASFIATRASEGRYAQLREWMQKVKYVAGEVHIIGVNQDAEKRLEGMGGIAGFKRW